MTHRCDTERDNPETARDPFNRPISTVSAQLADHPCYWQAQRGEFVADGQKLTEITQHFLLMPLSSDVLTQDIITRVVDRRGRVKIGQRLRVMNVVPREDHLECRLEEYA